MSKMPITEVVDIYCEDDLDFIEQVMAGAREAVGELVGFTYNVAGTEVEYGLLWCDCGSYSVCWFVVGDVAKAIVPDLPDAAAILTQLAKWKQEQSVLSN